MLYYLYNFDYSDFVNEQDASPPIVFNVYVHALADRLSIPALEKLAVSKFSARAKAEFKTPEFAAAVHEIYTNTADRKHELRTVCLDVCTTYAKVMHDEDWGAGLREVLTTIPAIGAEICAKLAKGAQSTGNAGKWYLCPNCGGSFHE